ncbi:AGAP000264-PA [Anopheles gambiae str. PEST]|uniref:AGAP000264-PA n=1 Tax=Anopheles gambiae TaxID=7165 RepID=Q7QF21_ANOGA|nr:AGAP000264-PA [Anopheles gambiae str. PEST]
MSGLTSDVYDEHLVDESSQYMLDDLQLAAELGKTLLERNKELEATLKHHQNIIEDHVQEIEYLTKQNAALREVNDSRMKIYEQLEVSIQDLERDKYKLALEYQAEKKHVKQLCSNIESLETKVEELTRSLEDARRQVEADRRTKKTERLLGQQQQQQQQQLPGQPAIVINSPTSHASKDAIPNVPSQEGVSTSRQTTEPCQSAKPMPAGAAKQSDPAAPSAGAGEPRTEEDGTEQCERDGGPTADDHTLSEDSEEMLRIMQELERTQKCLLSEQGKVGDLEEQLAVIAQENTALQSKLLNVHSTEIRSVHDELSMLEEFRQGPVCTRCLRDLGEQQDEDSIITGTTEDDASLMELIRNTDFPQAYRSSVTIEIEPTKPDSLDLALSECAGPTNPYRELVEKYEALLEVHRQPLGQKSATAAPTGAPGPATGVAGSGNNTPVDSCQPQQLLADAADLLPCGPSTLGAGGDAPERAGPGERRDGRAVAATECSETASSGYSDEVSNKATQTDESPRNFLCTIADGKDWRFNIYEDDSAIDSRFRFSPAHRELFREIFSVLRKAAENRDEGDQLPLLDDTKPGAANPPPAAARPGGGAAAVTVPPVTPANDEPPTGFGLEKDGQQGEGAVEQDDEVGETVSFVSSSAVSEQSFAMSECITKSERRRIARQAKAAGRYADGEQQGPNNGGRCGRPETVRPGLHPARVHLRVGGRAQGQIAPPQPPAGRSAHTAGAAAGGGGAAAAAAATTTPTPPRSGSARKHRTSFRPWNPERDGGVPIAADAASWSASAGRGHRSATPLSNAGTTTTATATPPSAAAVHPGSSRTSRRSEKKRNATAGLRNRYADLMQDALGDEVVEFRPSSASQHLHKLQKLDLSYAEVLRRADGGHPFPARRQYNQPQQQQ